MDIIDFTAHFFSVHVFSRYKALRRYGMPRNKAIGVIEDNINGKSW